MARLHALLLAWYAACRRDLPWRKTRDPYAIWVSEIMLQQTRVETVIPYYGRFLARFPTAAALAEAPADDVLALWSGLGYYRRARLLIEGARKVTEQGGALPTERRTLLSVPGIGRYTAGAIASIAFGEPVGLVDGNVARVLARLFAIALDMRKEGMRVAEALADEVVFAPDPGAWNQALMELGATVCTPRAPSCASCPVEGLCRARREGRTGELPILGARAPKARQKIQSVVVRATDGALVLARRRPDRTFGGLWEPPSVEGSSRARAKLSAWLPIQRMKRVGSVEHVLTHRHLEVEVLCASLPAGATLEAPPDDLGYDAVGFVPEADIPALGFSTLAKKVLAASAVAK